MKKDERLVYSTDMGRICPECQHAVEKCECSKQLNQPKSDGVVRVRRESKGRKGKVVTVVEGVPLPLEEVRELGRTLKALCGTGGTIKEFDIEIQGDKRELIIQELKKRGYTVKLSGG